MQKILFFCLVFISCNNNKIINIDGQLRAEGIISSDTIFDGQIKFYNINSNKLVVKANYTKGKLEGERLTYFDNGSIQTRENYVNDRLNGFTSFYDSSGELVSKQNFYYDFPTGSLLSFKNNKIDSFIFQNIAGEIIMSLSYDSLQYKSIVKLQKPFFFYHFMNPAYSKQLLVYTVSPPKFKWLYSLVAIDDKYKVLDSIKPFDPQLTCQFIDLDDYHFKVGVQALRLSIYDSIRNEHFTMFKRLN